MPTNKAEQPCEICSLTIIGERYLETAGDDSYNEIFWHERCECGAVVCKSHIKFCEGCGDIQVCPLCGKKYENHLYCSMDCVREAERKERKERPDFEGVFK